MDQTAIVRITTAPPSNGQHKSILSEVAGTCAICRTLVSGLDALCHGEEIDLQWTFKDRVPSLPNLAASADGGCPWCGILNRLIQDSCPNKPRASSDTPEPEETTIVVKCDVMGWRISRIRPLGNLRTVTIEPIKGTTNKRLKLYFLDNNDFDPLSPTHMEELHDAINTCLHDHGRCPSSTVSTSSPLRLLDVMAGDSVKLELMGERRVKYVALSYCWGPDGPETKAHITLQTNVAKREKGFELNEIPKTLRDAVLTTRSLGIRYIWIDGLCIVQDCHAEWERESMRMMHYYGNAYLTIVPVMSDSVATGMRHDEGNKPFSVKIPSQWTCNLCTDIVLAVKGSRYDEALSILPNSAWSQRGWTYQEMLMSSRLLFVFDHNMTLRCRKGTWDSLRGWDSGKYGAAYFLPANDVAMDPEEIPLLEGPGSYREWCRLVYDFTGRKLSRATDRWAAFSGIAEKYCKSFNRQIVAGLWKDRLLEELVSWAPSNPLPVWNPDLVLSDNTTRQVTFPSWSWIGKDWSGDGYGLKLHVLSVWALEGHQPRAEIESIVNERDLGSTKLQLAGYLLDGKSFLTCLGGCVWEGPGYRTVGLDHCHCLRPHSMQMVCNTNHDPRTLIPPLTPAVSGLLIGVAEPVLDRRLHWLFLLIQLIGNGTTRASTLPEYRRIGIMRIKDGDMNTIYSAIKDQLIRSGKKGLLLV